jgi:uncharacterized protein (DUF433 family)
MTFRLAACGVALNEVDGQVRILGTRVTLDTVVVSFQQGATPEEIVQDYSALALADVYAIYSFYLQNRGAVETYLREREVVSERIRCENQQRFSVNDLRERLLARQ